MDRKQTRALVKGLVLLLTLIGVGVLLKTLSLENMADADWIDQNIRGKGLAGLALFAGMGALFTGVGLPRQIIAFLAGYAYGFVMGTLMALFATAIGCGGAFFYARFLGQRFVTARLKGKIRGVDEFLKKKPFTMTLIIRFMPVGSNIATNLAAGVSSIKALPFLAGSTLGFLPQTLIFALLGSGFQVDTGWRISLSAALFLLSAYFGFSLYRRHKAGAVNGEN